VYSRKILTAENGDLQWLTRQQVEDLAFHVALAEAVRCCVNSRLSRHIKALRILEASGFDMKNHEK
jgi:DNA-binding FadR family transcriptional regulator